MAKTRKRTWRARLVVRNVAQGFMDAGGNFHPIRRSWDYEGAGGHGNQRPAEGPWKYDPRNKNKAKRAKKRAAPKKRAAKRPAARKRARHPKGGRR